MKTLVAVLAVLIFAPSASAAGTVTVLYAGSLVNVMEQQIGPAFSQATGYGYSGYGAGSTAVANQIKGKLKQGDVFISAAPSVNRNLMGSGNGDWVTWYGEFATAPLVIGFNPSSKYATAFKTKPWWTVLSTPGLLLGRTDPVLDPKGVLTIQFINRASKTLGMPNLLAQTLVTPSNTAQVFPEETLVGRLQAGQLDAGFFYSIEAKAANIPFVAPPLGKHYGARYTITILNNDPNPAGALAFVQFLLGPQGTAILKQDGFQLLNDGETGGVTSSIPASVKPLFGTKPKK
ncbi:MAG TPA: extracellular solute-binding protein [Gaiellaceae bacterium]|nr:extracellular solute-binding protein [Gaiellaceae bacterium]